MVKDATTIYVAGSFQDTSIFVHDTLISQNDYDIFLAKFNVDTTVSIHQISTNETDTIQGMLIYPNPSNQQSNLYYTLNQATDVQINVYDLLGRSHQEIKIKHQDKGTHQIIIDQPKSSGIYFIELKTKQTSKVIAFRFNPA